MSDQIERSTSLETPSTRELGLRLSEALTEGFEFYHLGKVARLEVPIEGMEPALMLGYAFSGDARGVVVALVHGELDESAAEELGNIIACRWVSKQDPALDLVLTSPTKISPAALDRMLQTATLATRADYELSSPQGLALAKITALVLAEPARNV